MFHRTINIPKSQSFFLFGPRGSGKSTLIKSIFPENKRIYIDLLLATEETRLSKNPDELEKDVLGSPNKKYVIIDEIQKIPKLLDIVHRLIESTDRQFILTGSSARKLKAGAANLLAGRAFERHLHPLTSEELGDSFDLQEAIRWGTLPKLFQLEEKEKEDFLFAYANAYLREEVWGEHLIRKLEPFRKFLEVAAQSNGKILNYSKIGKAVDVDTKTIQTYYQILEDTLIGFILEPYHRSVRRRVHKNPKFYFFDTGVTRTLAGLLKVLPEPSTSHFGDLFEQWVILEFLRMESYLKQDFRFYYYRTLEDQEIDLVIERPGMPLALLEIKSTDQVDSDSLKKFDRVRKHFKSADSFCLSRDPHIKNYHGIQAMPWMQGIRNIMKT